MCSGIVCQLSCTHLDASHLDEYLDFISLMRELPSHTLRTLTTYLE